MRIAVGSDHAGVELRRAVAEHLTGAGHAVTSHGPEEGQSVDYPDVAADVARAVRDGAADRGVLICGTGIGMSMAANRVRGVRAAVCTSEYEARMARAHNDANVLCLGARVLGPGAALGTTDVFVSTGFEGGRHTRRIDKITALEQEGPP